MHFVVRLFGRTEIILFRNAYPNCLTILSHTNSFLQELSTLEKGANHPTDQIVDIQWSPPHMGLFKVNFDGAFHVPSTSSADAITHNNSRHIIVAPFLKGHACLVEVAEAQVVYIPRAQTQPNLSCVTR